MHIPSLISKSIIKDMVMDMDANVEGASEDEHEL
jgi:hypothetical protein